MTKRVYRSSEQAIIAGIIGVIGCGVAVGMLLEAKKMAGFVFVIVYFAVLLPIIVRLALSRVTASESGVYVANVFFSRKLLWKDIEKFEIGRWKIFPYVCLIRLRDGRFEHAFGIQERTNFADGSGEKLAGELNAELRGHTAGLEGRRHRLSRIDACLDGQGSELVTAASAADTTLIGVIGAMPGLPLVGLEAEGKVSLGLSVPQRLGLAAPGELLGLGSGPTIENGLNNRFTSGSGATSSC